MSVGEVVYLNRALPDKSVVIFTSNSIDLNPDTEAYIDNTSVNLLSADGDHLLHVSIRRAENRICFNAKDSDEWGSEESVALDGVFRQRGKSSISISIRHPTFVVSVDNTPIHTFMQRIDKEVGALEYRTNGLSESVFPGHIDVRVVRRDDSYITSDDEDD
jgi:hypothetical protein